jgi:hypothetical protein
MHPTDHFSSNRRLSALKTPGPRNHFALLAAPMLLVLVLLLTNPASIHAQGTVNFHNLPPVPDAPVFDIDGTTRLNGPRYQAFLVAGPTADSLAPVGPSVPFLTGEGAGYFAGGTRTIPTVIPGQTAFLEVRYWDTATGATWEEAAYWGGSPVFVVVTGGAGEPPSLPSTLVGLQSFNLIPEPSTLLLGSIALAPFLWRFTRRRILCM